MSTISSTSLVLESLEDRLQEAEENKTVPLNDAYRQWRQRALDRDRSNAMTRSNDAPFIASIGKVVAIAAAVGAAAAVYKALSSHAPTSDVLSRIRESLSQPAGEPQVSSTESHRRDQDSPTGSTEQYPAGVEIKSTEAQVR